MKTLVVNTGSSTYKLTLYDIDNGIMAQPQSPLWHGVCEWKVDSCEMRLSAWVQENQIIDQKISEKSPEKAFDLLLKTITDKGLVSSLAEIAVVGHRVVHGGSAFYQPTLVTEKVKETIRELFLLAPLHNPINLEGIEIAQKLLPKIPHIAVFDTAFHTTLSEAAKTYAGPYGWRQKGIQRYGFHGINYQYCAARCATLLQRDVQDLKLVCCHLGNGASMAAIDGGRSVDTTMGFTPLEGLMMGSRCGSIDPGILLFLQQHEGVSAAELEKVLNEQSGLRGVSGVSSDMRDIIALREKGDPRGVLAFEMYIHAFKRNFGAMAAALGGLDAVVFSAGTGENSPLVREQACQGLAHLGIDLDGQKNQSVRGDGVISSTGSSVVVMVIVAQEEWAIACACCQVLLV